MGRTGFNRMSIRVSFFILSVYILINVFFGMYFSYIGFFNGGDFKGFPILNYEIYFKVFVSEIFLIISLYVVSAFIFFVRISQKFICNKSKVLDYFVIFLQAAYLIYAYSTGVGVVSEDFYTATSNSPVRYVFAIFHPDYFFIAYYFIFRNVSKTNVLLFIFSNLIRGWFAGSLLFLTFVYLSKNYRSIKVKYIFILFVVFILLAPTVYFVKYSARGKQDVSLLSYLSYYSYDTYSIVMTSAFSRFQHISELYYVDVNMNEIRDDFDKKNIVPFYLDNPSLNIISPLLGYNSTETLNAYVTRQYLGVESGNTHIGPLAWLNINLVTSLLFLFFYIVSVFSASYLLKSMSAKNVTFTFFTTIFCLFFIHGWFNAYFLILWSLFIIYMYCLFRRSFFKWKGKIK